MGLNRHTTRTFHRCLYAGILITVRLLKRGDDQQQGTVTAYTMFEVRQSRIVKRGEGIIGDETSDRTCSFLVPRTELQRLGIPYISAADRFVDPRGRYWQPESPDVIDDKLFENYISVPCRSIHPPIPTGDA